MANCPSLANPSGTTILEYVYKDTGIVAGILVNIRGNPTLKVPGYTDSCGPVSGPIPSPNIPSGSMFPLGTTNLQYTVQDREGLTGTCRYVFMINNK